MWVYSVSDGKLYGPLGTLVGRGYSGRPPGINNPAFENVHMVGPIPEGLYSINSPVDTQTHGPFVLWLTPDPENMMFNRSGFGIHGDSTEHPGLASDGCIIMPRIVREAIWQSPSHTLRVIPGPAPVLSNAEDVRAATTGEN